MGATPQEIEETLTIAMVVGASKVKLMGRDCLAPLGGAAPAAEGAPALKPGGG